MCPNCKANFLFIYEISKNKTANQNGREFLIKMDFITKVKSSSQVGRVAIPVSYTHLTLPTIYSV